MKKRVTINNVKINYNEKTGEITFQKGEKAQALKKGEKCAGYVTTENGCEIIP